MRFRIPERIFGILTRWMMVAAWMALMAVWLVWRASREPNMEATGWPWPVYHVWFLAVTGALLALGIALASTKTTAGETPWERHWVTVFVGSACLACGGFEIIDMVYNCQFVYGGFWVP